MLLLPSIAFSLSMHVCTLGEERFNNIKHFAFKRTAPTDAWNPVPFPVVPVIATHLSLKSLQLFAMQSSYTAVDGSASIAISSEISFCAGGGFSFK